MYQQSKDERTTLNALCVANCFCYDRCVWSPINREYFVAGQTKPALWKRECHKSGFLYLSLVLLVGSQVLFLILNEPYIRHKIATKSSLSILQWLPLIVTEIFFMYALLFLVATACVDPGILPQATQIEKQLIEYEQSMFDLCFYVLII